MTVNELLKELRQLQKEGRGNQTVFIYRKEDTYCMPATRVQKHHAISNGHVVVKSDIGPSDLQP